MMIEWEDSWTRCGEADFEIMTHTYVVLYGLNC